MIPKYAFRVIVTSRLGERLQQQAHNYETLSGAMAYRDIMLRKPTTARVEVVMVLDETVARSGENECPMTRRVTCEQS